MLNLNILLNTLITPVLADAAEPFQLGFQDPGSVQFEGIQILHDSVMFYLVVITIAVFWVLFAICYLYVDTRSKFSHKYLTHGSTIETIWTILPALVLAFIAVPSFQLLYLLDEVISPDLTIKAVGNQWFWSYEFSDFVTADGEPIEFDSYMIPDSDLELGQFRNLDVDNRIYIPVDAEVRVITTARDVIHNFAISSLGLKMDSIPGRLNEQSFLADRTGVFFGHCSELCGVGHAFMPIVIEVLEPIQWIEWIRDFE